MPQCIYNWNFQRKVHKARPSPFSRWAQKKSAHVQSQTENMKKIIIIFLIIEQEACSLLASLHSLLRQGYGASSINPLSVLQHSRQGSSYLTLETMHIGFGSFMFGAAPPLGGTLLLMGMRLLCIIEYLLASL